MERNRIVIIGAGSAMFTQGLVADLIRSGRPWKLGLVDIDPAALETAAGLSQRMVEAKEADILIESSTDRRDLLLDAAVVVTTIGVGGRRAWEADVSIPRQYGIFQPVGDTAMPGGISRALRMVPAMVEIAQDVRKFCPRAHFFNYANPMTANCWAVRKATGAGVVGLCIGTIHVVHDLARFIGAPPADVTALAAGLNHFTWVYDLRVGGRDARPQMRAQLARERAAGDRVRGADLAPGGDTIMAAEMTRRPRASDNPFSWSLFEAYDAYPAVHDRHVIEFFPERFPGGAYCGRTLGVDVFSIEDTIAHGDRIYEQMQAQALGQLPLDEGVFSRATGEHSQLVEIICALQEDRRGVYYANLPNRGAIPNLPSEAVLEMTCVATGRGLQPLLVPDFPQTLAAHIQRRLASISLTVDAALSGNRKLFVEALLADGAVTEPATAAKLADDLLRAQAPYLPQFA